MRFIARTCDSWQEIFRLDANFCVFDQFVCVHCVKNVYKKLKYLLKIKNLKIHFTYFRVDGLFMYTESVIFVYIYTFFK